MQNLSLYASVSKSQYQLTVDSLSTLTGSNPQDYATVVLLASPKVIVKYEPNSKTTQYEQHKLHFKSLYDEKHGFDVSQYREWVVQTFDIPFVSGKRKVSNQNVLESHVDVGKDTLPELLDELGYKPDLVYMIKGVKFYYGSISLEIFQIFIKKDGEVVNLDENLYILRCFINVEKSTDVENLTNGSQELMNLKAELAGLVELETPDRNLMDSRIGIRK